MRWLITLLLGVTACGGTTPGQKARYVSPTQGTAALACEDGVARHWAVVVGINQYEDERISDLGGAVGDAWAFYHYLISPGGGSVDPARVRLLLDSDATRAGVEGALGNFLRAACPADQVYVFFAGHGAPEPGGKEAFLLVHDTDLDNMVGTAVAMSRLAEFLRWRAGQTGSLVMFVDACHSGNIRFPGGRGVEETWRSAVVVDGVADAVKGKPGWGAITATQSGQLAWESKASCNLGGAPYAGGLFTCRLLDGLHGSADADVDGTVTVGELFDHLRSRVYEDSVGAQIPQLSGDVDRALALPRSKGGRVLIPMVPERYATDDDPHPLRPYAWVGAGLTGAAVVTAGVFHVRANLRADAINDMEPGLRTEAEYDAQRDEQESLQAVALTAWTSAGVLAVVTGALWLLDEIERPGDANDAYGGPPWIEFGAGPGPDGGVRATALWRF